MHHRASYFNARVGEDRRVAGIPKPSRRLFHDSRRHMCWYGADHGYGWEVGPVTVLFPEHRCASSSAGHLPCGDRERTHAESEQIGEALEGF